MNKLFTAAFLAVLAIAAARCPNGCSGHGNCGGSDKCSCWGNWQGPDCSQRTCRFDIAWATDHWNDAHYYAECSGKGLCDRETGECQCFEGYTGVACKRSVCPNDCSGHGKCRLVEELPAATAYGNNPYTDWDSDKIQACVCDGGFYGPDCSLRWCPRGDDPMTICDVTDNEQVQLLTVEFQNYLEAGDEHVTNDELALKFTDNHNETWWTPRITGIWDNSSMGTGESNIKEALESIPNFKIPSVDVNNVDFGRAGEVNYLITFTDERNSGNQTLLQCDFPLGCMTDGCQPKYRQPRVVTIDTPTFTHPAVITDAAELISITNDSVLDGYFSPSGGIDEASLRVHDVVVTVTVFANESTAYNSYSSKFVFGTDSFSATEEADTFHGRIPNGASDRGIGFDHAPIGHGLFIAFPSRKPTSGDYVITYSVPRCFVTQVTAANSEKEDIECSGRGHCDVTTGMCGCFEGYYGDHCALQTILV